jgi:ribose/xylose/arabinose/galactoside ABC-type transport system permease subunit
VTERSVQGGAQSVSVGLAGPPPRGGAGPWLTRHRVVPALRWGFLLLIAVVALATPGFVSAPSLLALLTTVSFLGCIAVGMTLITISGNIMSFSLGATAGASTIIFLNVFNGAGLAAGLAAALAFGILVCLAQGLLIGRLGANPIIVSIASVALIYGIFQRLTEGLSVYSAAPAAYALVKGKVLGMPFEFVVFLALVVIGQLILSFTVLGRNLYMVGNSLRAANAAGIRSWATIAGAYVLAGLFTAASGILLATHYDTGNMLYGVGFDYSAIAAVLVGGTAIQGGQGSVLRTLVGVMIIGIVQVVLLLQGFRQEWQDLITGVIVLAVIILNTRWGRR